MSETQWKELIKTKKIQIEEAINKARSLSAFNPQKRFVVYLWNSGVVNIFQDYRENTNSGYIAEKRNECRKICEI